MSVLFNSLCTHPDRFAATKISIPRVFISSYNLIPRSSDPLMLYPHFHSIFSKDLPLIVPALNAEFGDLVAVRGGERFCRMLTSERPGTLPNSVPTFPTLLPVAGADGSRRQKTGVMRGLYSTLFYSTGRGGGDIEELTNGRWAGNRLAIIENEKLEASYREISDRVVHGD
jgi:hypothetical protein